MDNSFVWADYRPFELFPGTEPPRRESPEWLTDFVPTIVSDEYVDWIDVDHVLVYLRNRSQLEALSVVFAPKSRDEIVRRLDQVLMARCRTPYATLNHEQALDLANKHMRELAKLLDREDLAELIAPTLTSLLSRPLIVVDNPESAAAEAIQMPYGLRRSPEIEPEAIIPEADTSYFTTLLQDYVVAWSEPAEEAPYESYTWDEFGQSFRLLLGTEEFVKFYVLRPACQGTVDPSFYYELWRAGASLWLTDTAIEVRTYTASREPRARYTQD